MISKQLYKWQALTFFLPLVGLADDGASIMSESDSVAVGTLDEGTSDMDESWDVSCEALGAEAAIICG